MSEEQIINFRLCQIEQVLTAALRGMGVLQQVADSMAQAEPELRAEGVPNEAFTLLKTLRAHLAS